MLGYGDLKLQWQSTLNWGLQLFCFIFHVRNKTKPVDIGYPTQHLSLLQRPESVRLAEVLGFQFELIQKLQYELVPNHNWITDFFQVATILETSWYVCDNEKYVKSMDYTLSTWLHIQEF